MTLTEIEYGSLASSAVLNNNFQYLQDKVTELSALITSETSSYSSAVATLNNSINTLLQYKEAFIPVGTIIASQNSEIPTGFLLCDGSEVSIDEYEDLYDIIGTTYGEASSDTMFCLPDLTNKTLWGISSDTTVGQNMEAGLPNITGGYQHDGWSGYGYYGAVTANTGRPYTGTGAGGTSSNGFKLDASKSSAIYGRSNTVQPASVITNFVIKY